MLTYKMLNDLGRLGNQFFQLYSTIGLAKKNNQSWLFPQWNYKKYLNVPEEWFSDNISLYNDISNTYLQDYNNFNNIKDLIIQTAIPSNLIIDEINNLKNKWLPDNDTEYIMIGIRRTDYTANTNYYPPISAAYYRNGINFIKEKTNNKQLKIICFSDDIEWCKNNIPADIYYNDNHSIDIIKLFLMSHCDHFIIANSTFYWWSAYLSNKNKNKIVIYPMKWLGPGIPDKHTFNLFYPEWYGFTNSNGIPINFPNKLNINILDAINKEDF